MHRNRKSRSAVSRAQKCYRNITCSSGYVVALDLSTIGRVGRFLKIHALTCSPDTAGITDDIRAQFLNVLTAITDNDDLILQPSDVSRCRSSVEKVAMWCTTVAKVAGIRFNDNANPRAVSGSEYATAVPSSDQEDVVISAVMLRALMRALLGGSSDSVVDAIFVELVDCDDCGCLAVNQFFESVICCYLDNTSTSSSSSQLNLQANARSAARLLVEANRQSLGTRSSIDLDVTGRMLRNRARVVDSFSAAIHGDDDNLSSGQRWAYMYLGLNKRSQRQFLKNILDSIDRGDVVKAIKSSQPLTEALGSIVGKSSDTCGGTKKGMDVRVALRIMYLVGVSRRQGDSLIAELRHHFHRIPRSKEVWSFRESLVVPKSHRFTECDETKFFGCGRYVRTDDLLRQIFQVRELVQTMKLDFDSPVNSNRRILVSFSVDGAELNSTAGAIFGFMRILNQVDYIDSPLMQFPVLLAQTNESRTFLSQTLPQVLAGLISLQTTGVDVVCVDDECCSRESEAEHSHRFPLDFIMICDLKCLKEILNRQAGSPAHGCFCCDAVTTSFQKRIRPKGNYFSNELIRTKSDEWFAEWQMKAPNVSAKVFEHSDEGKNWSRENMSFAGVYYLPKVGIEQYMVDYLHLTLRIIPFIFGPIVSLVTNLMEIGAPGVTLFVDGMNAIGLGHVAKRFLKKYCLRLDEHNRTNSANSASARALSASSRLEIDEYVPPPSPARTANESRASLRGRRKRRGGGGGGSTSRTAKHPKKARTSNDMASQGAKSLNRTNEQQAVMDALSDHEVVKFIGRDCRALEAGYSTLLTFLCEDSEVYVQRLNSKHAVLIQRQVAANDALDNLEMQENDMLAQNVDILEEEERIVAYRIEVETEIESITAELLRACSEEGYQPPMNEAVSNVKLLWDSYMEVMKIVRKTHPTEEEVNSIGDIIDTFAGFYIDQYEGNQSQYFHILRDHIEDKLKYCYQRWGIGLGFFSTQASEHGNKLAKSAMRHLNGFTDVPFNKFDMYIRDRLVRILHFPDSIRKPLLNTDTCSKCGRKGHRKNNKNCPMASSAISGVINEDGVEEEKRAESEE